MTKAATVVLYYNITAGKNEGMFQFIFKVMFVKLRWQQESKGH